MNFKKTISSVMAGVMTLAAMPALPVTLSQVAFADETVETMADAEVLTNGESMTGEVGEQRMQYYTFTIDENCLVDINYIMEVQTNAATKMCLFNEYGELIKEKEYGVINWKLALLKGKYYIKIQRTNGGSTYTLSYKTRAAEETFPETIEENNNTAPDASVITAGTPVYGMVGLNDETDIYKYTVDTNKEVYWDINSSMDDLNFTILNTAGEKLFNEELKKDELLGTINKHYEYAFSEGTYYIVVKKNESEGAYNFVFKEDKEIAGQIAEIKGRAGDLNEDGKIDASDASVILSYYAFTQTGGKLSVDDWYEDVFKKK